MHVSVPLAALLAALGTYGVVVGAMALARPEKSADQRANVQAPVEWVGVICIALFGMLGSALALAALFGTAPWTPYLVATPIVALLGFAFFKMLEITPIPLFAWLANTRHHRLPRRRSMLNNLRMMVAESSIDGDVVNTQAEVQQSERSRAALRGAMTLAGLITTANLLWAGKVVSSYDASFLFLTPFLLLYVALVVVLSSAARSMSRRGNEIDWRRPF